MKKILCMVLCLMLMTPAMAVEAVKLGDLFEVAYCNEYITLRAEPSTKAEALDRLLLGEDVRYLGSDGHGFARVLTMDGAAGYVLEKYLAPMSATAIAHKDVEWSEQEYYNVNLFLTNFTEQYFASPVGYFDVNAANDAEMVQFAIEHIWFNRQDDLEWGEWGNGSYNVRLSDQYIAPVCEKYFGRAPENLSPLYMDYSGGYYYWLETGGHVPGGFAQASEMVQIGPDSYRVVFSVYGQGMAWDESVYGMGERRLAHEHPEYFSKYQPRGSAVFTVGEGGSLTDRSGWKLKNLCMDWEVFSGVAE